MDAPSPTWIVPRILAPVPMSTRWPITGEPLIPAFRRPMVTPFRNTTSSPSQASPLMTIPYEWSILSLRPTRVSQGISAPLAARTQANRIL